MGVESERLTVRRLIADYAVVWKDIGFLPEENPLWGDMRVAEFLKDSAEPNGIQKDLLDGGAGRVVEKQAKNKFPGSRFLH